MSTIEIITNPDPAPPKPEIPIFTPGPIIEPPGYPGIPPILTPDPLPNPIPPPVIIPVIKIEDLNFKVCINNFVISIKADSFLCLKSDISELKTIFSNKCHYEPRTNININSMKIGILKNTSKIDLKDENFYLKCSMIIKEYFDNKTNEDLCKSSSSFAFFKIYQTKCIVDPIIWNQNDFITSMASVHKNTIADRQLYARLNRGASG